MASRKKIMQVAQDVIAGSYGSGDARVNALKKAGYNPTTVQTEVNRLLSCRELIIQNMRAWATKIVNSKKYKYVYWTEPYGHECAVCHPHDGKNKGWQCIGFVFACWHHGGLPSECDCGVIDNGTGEKMLKVSDAEALKIARRCIGIKDIKVIRNAGKMIPSDKLQAGDICLCFDGYTYQHMIFIMGDGKIADSTSSKGANIGIRNLAPYQKNMPIKIAIRYTGNGLIKPQKKTVDELAHEVIDGLWYSGAVRKKALTECGYNYDAVQKRVNELLEPKKDPMPKALFSDFVGTTVKVGQATGDEKGGTKGGKAGDQTGGEVSMSKYSYSSKSGSYNHWEYVFRAKNKSARIKIADACIKACNNNHIGYDTGSPDRKSLFKEAEKKKWAIDKITTNCETTCSELANVCIAAAGLKSYLPVGKPAYVDKIRTALLNSSEFSKVKLNANTLQPGDILVSNSHVAIIVQSMIMPKENSKRVSDMQEYLNWYTGGKFFKECGKADGVYGNNTLKYVIAFQEKEIGKGQGDGTVGSKTIDAMKKVKK